MAPVSSSPSPAGSVPVQTLIFVDVDGVLNVGIGDPGSAPMEFNASNVEKAAAVWDKRHNFSAPVRSCLERIVATQNRELGQDEDSTYEKLVSSPATSLSDVLVGRLAKLILASGEQCKVVLSSTWRLPKHARRARVLEEAIGKHLGRPFEFDARTSCLEDRTASGRLRCIGDFAAEYCRKHGGSIGELRMLVLEDFHVSPLGTWSCGGRNIDCPKDAEDYLCSRIPTGRVDASAKLIHTFDEWSTDDGLQVQVGSGITYGRFCDALTFLNGPREEDEPPVEAATTL